MLELFDTRLVGKFALRALGELPLFGYDVDVWLTVSR